MFATYSLQQRQSSFQGSLGSAKWETISKAKRQDTEAEHSINPSMQHGSTQSYSIASSETLSRLPEYIKKLFLIDLLLLHFNSLFLDVRSFTINLKQKFLQSIYHFN